MKVMEIGKLSKEIDLAVFYILDKDKILMEDKLKKMREGVQLLAIMDQSAIKKRKIIIANINSRLKG
jgi:hypothetical protein